MPHKMSDISFSSRAYCKIILHAAKYPHCAVNGLLLAKQRSKGDSDSSELRIEDAIPLFHICLDVAPMAELALMLVEQVAASRNLMLAGYYLANENINDLSTDRPAGRIADKIAENINDAIMVVVDNRRITLGMIGIGIGMNTLRISQIVDGKWKSKDSAEILLDQAVANTNAMYSLMKAEQYRNLVDFDNHLDNVAADWQNRKLNKIIDEAVEKSK